MQGPGMTIAERVKKHREKLIKNYYGRLDVWISQALIELLRELAKVHGRWISDEIHDAIAAYLRRLLNLSSQVTMVQAHEAVERYALKLKERKSVG
jgi:biotin-(acetyl-CoA carboxylase) ligase